MVKPYDNEILKYSFGDRQFFKQMISHSSRCSNHGEWYMWCLVYSWIDTMQEKTEKGWCESIACTPPLFCHFLYCLYPTVQIERKRSQKIFSYNSGCKKKVLNDFLASSSSLKTSKLHEAGFLLGVCSVLKDINLLWALGLKTQVFRDTLILVFVNKNCCLCMFHRIIVLLLIVSSLFCHFNRCAVCFQSFSEHCLQENSKCRAYQTLLKITHRYEK